MTDERYTYTKLSHYIIRRLLPAAVFLFLCTPSAGEFLVPPYLQNLSTHGIALVWFSGEEEPGRLQCFSGDDKEPVFQAVSSPQQVKIVKAPPFRYRHVVNVTGLKPNTLYRYEVVQRRTKFHATFRTPPEDGGRVRFIVYADCETEPESTGKRVTWADPRRTGEKRLYLVDQTTGYANNLAVIRSRRPSFIIIAGDLVESGGEQQDWDEFWRHNTALDGSKSLAGNIPILPALGNHDYYAGPKNGGYAQPHSEAAVARFLSYFRVPSNGSPIPEHEGRFYRFNYGPVTIIVLDVNNGLPHRSKKDTNFFLLGEGEGGCAPDFQPGSYQHKWLQRQLLAAQNRSKFTFVAFHHTPYSSGPHGKPPGTHVEKGDPLSGVPVRVLTPLFLRYGVDAVFCGHDEMLERSEVAGEEILHKGHSRRHTIHFYDVGIGGDGLRSAAAGVDNPHQRFLAKEKHYGHLEVNVSQADDGRWKAVLTPVYVLPRLDGVGKNTYTSFQRKVYSDEVTLYSR